MHRNGIFIIVFVFTLISTLAVTAVSLITQQDMVRTVIYSLATMWIVGIVSQVLVQNLYQGIVKPLEEARADQQRKAQKKEVNLEDVEAIDDALESFRSRELQEQMERKEASTSEKNLADEMVKSEL